MRNCINIPNMYVKQAIKLSLLASIAMSFQTSVSAADWLSLQAMEPDYVAPQGVLVPNRNKVPKLWGFAQFNYRNDTGNVVVNGGGANVTPFSLLQPDLTDTSGFNLFRARLGVRGMADDDNLVDYFILTEFGNSGVSNPNGKKEVGSYLTDASITLRHIPGANIRAGIFKTPGSEEGLGSVYYYPYVEFSSFTDGQLLERTVRKVGTAATGTATGTGLGIVHYTGAASDAVGAFRDTGIEVFDTFNIDKDWAFSYAYMLGNGSGISQSSSNTNQTQYGYLALEKKFGGGKGYMTNAMKFYVWGQDGKRSLISDDNNASTNNTAKLKFDRERYGVGATYFNNGLRLEAEYAKAKGMIFTGATDVSSDPGIDDWSLTHAVGKENKADGGYINAQYYVVPDKFELIARYDWMNRLTNSATGRRDFETTTVGFSYHFKEATRLDFNYAFKDAKAPGNATAQTILDNTGDRISLQLTAGF